MKLDLKNKGNGVILKVRQDHPHPRSREVSKLKAFSKSKRFLSQGFFYAESFDSKKIFGEIS
jgi:hypothetical protein